MHEVGFQMDEHLSTLGGWWSIFEIVEKPNCYQIRLLRCMFLGVSEDQEHTVCDVSHKAYPSDIL